MPEQIRGGSKAEGGETGLDGAVCAVCSCVRWECSKCGSCTAEMWEILRESGVDQPGLGERRRDFRVWLTSRSSKFVSEYFDENHLRLYFAQAKLF